MPEAGKSKGAMDIVVLVAVFVLAVVVLKFVFGFFLTAIKWALIIAVAYGIAVTVRRRIGSGGSS